MTEAGERRWFRPAEWVRAAWRILLFLALFIGLFAAGALLFGRVLQTLRGPVLLLQSGVLLIAAFVAGAVLIRRVDGRPIGALGTAWTSRTWTEMLLGLAIGVGAIGVGAGVMVAAGSLRFTGDYGSVSGYADGLLQHLWFFFVAAFAEEALYRGYPFQVLVQTFGGVVATVVMSVAFAVGHAGNPNVGAFGLVNIFLAGVLLSVAYLRTRSLWFPTMLHLGWNWGMASLLDLPVSGLELIDTALYEPAVRGPEWFTGGSFGPEGGLVGSLGFVAALAAVLLLPGVQPSSEMTALQPLPDG